MAIRKFTDPWIRGLKKAAPGTRDLWSDKAETGLSLMVNDKGRVTFLLFTRFPQADGTPGNPSRRVLGDYQPRDDRGHPRPVKRGVEKLTLEAARAKARQWKAAIANGVDPTKPDPAGDSQEGADDESGAELFESVYGEFMKRHVLKEGQIDFRGRPVAPLRSAREIQRLFKRYILDDADGHPRWRGRDIRSIRRADVTALMDDVQDKSGTGQADAVLAQISSLCNWYAARADGYVSPIIKGMKRADGSSRARKRILDDREIGLLWKATSGADPFNGLVRMALLTGQRRAKLADMRHADLSPDGVWTIPAEDREKANASFLKLPPLAMDIIRAQPRHASSPFVFPGRFDDRPQNGFSKAKAQLDAAIAKKGRDAIPRWVIHDLRRTAKSLMVRAGVPAHISERVLGHAIPGVEGIYDRHHYLEEKAAALRSLAKLINGIVTKPTPPEKIPPAPRRRISTKKGNS